MAYLRVPKVSQDVYVQQKVTKVTKSKQGGSGNKKRKVGDWIAISKGRVNRDREVVNRSNRDYPNMGEVGSAAYRRLVRK